MTTRSLTRPRPGRSGRETTSGNKGRQQPSTCCSQAGRGGPGGRQLGRGRRRRRRDSRWRRHSSRRGGRPTQPTGLARAQGPALAGAVRVPREHVCYWGGQNPVTASFGGFLQVVSNHTWGGPGELSRNDWKRETWRERQSRTRTGHPACEKPRQKQPRATPCWHNPRPATHCAALLLATATHTAAGAQRPRQARGAQGRACAARVCAAG